MTRRALVVAPTPYFVEKGSTLRVDAMVERLCEEGYHVDLVCYDRGSDPERAGVTVSRAGIGSLVDTGAGPSITDLLNDLFVAGRVLRKVRSTDYELFQGEDVEGIAIALLAASFSDAETVYDVHNPLTENLQLHGIPIPPALSRRIEGVLYRRSDRIIANWHVWADDIRSRYGIDRVETVHDAVPDGMCPLELPADRYLTYVGNFEDYQGVDLLIEAFETVATETDVDLLLVGEPNESIRRAVAASPVTDRIHMLGRRSVEASNYIIANAVASVVPRRYGAQPSTKLLHYAMHDPPIIATDLECNRELERLDHDVCWAAPTAKGIADCIEEVCHRG